MLKPIKKTAKQKLEEAFAKIEANNAPVNQEVLNIQKEMQAGNTPSAFQQAVQNNINQMRPQQTQATPIASYAQDALTGKIVPTQNLGKLGGPMPVQDLGKLGAAPTNTENLGKLGNANSIRKLSDQGRQLLMDLILEAEQPKK